MTDENGTPVQAAYWWASNAEMIADAARLGYLRQDWPTIDVTYGRGVWWKCFRPTVLVTHDLKIDGVDFRHLPHPDASFRVVAYDPPYKYNGTPTIADGSASSDVDERFGVDDSRTWQERDQLIREGMVEVARVVRPRGYVLMKCQDQVCSGSVHWQTLDFSNHGAGLGLELVDRLDLLGTGRAQPPRRRKDKTAPGGYVPSGQQHAYGRPSTLLVFRRVASPQNSALF
jgi:hypothetical protein